ncbi:MAG: radical SAM protein [Paraclostridium sp.]
MKRDSMFLLVKPTHECNLSCEYCYDAKEKLTCENKIIKDEAIEKISKLCSETYFYVNWIWHGGEPLMVSTENYKKWHKGILENTKGMELEFGMQSNGALYTKEIKKDLQDLGVKYTISYDIINDNEKRKNAKKIQSIDPYGELGAITVVDFDSSFKLIETYEFLKISKRKITFNKIFLDKKTNENMEQYADNWIAYFKHYIFDKACIKDDIFFHSIFNKIFGIDKSSSFCAENKCINKFLSVNPDGKVFPCDRFGVNNADHYCYGNVEDYKYSMNEYIFTDGFNKYKDDLLKADEKCKGCEISVWCAGGCKANRVDSDGKINVSVLNEYDCIFYKKVYSFIFDTIFNLKVEEFIDLNPNIYEDIFEEKIMLKCFIDGIKRNELDDKFIVG